jgi:hemolysin-activating ACP:hemolysin acyltransferase
MLREQLHRLYQLFLSQDLLIKAKRLINSVNRIARLSCQLRLLSTCLREGIMIPSLSNLHFPRLIQGDFYFLTSIRIQLLRRMKRKLYGLRQKEFLLNERWTSQLRNYADPTRFEDILAICNAEHHMQTRLMSEIHRNKLNRWMTLHRQTHQNYTDQASSSDFLSHQNQGVTAIPSTSLTNQRVVSQHDSTVSPLLHSPPFITTSLSLSHQMSTTGFPLSATSSQSNLQRVTIIPSTSLPEITQTQLSLLSKGPKFIPTIDRVNDTVILKHMVGFHRLMNQIRWKERRTDSSQYSHFLKSPNFQEVNLAPVNPTIERKINQVSVSFHSLMSNIRNKKVARNLTSIEWAAIKSLKNPQLKVVPSDKGGDFCVCDASSYKTAVLNHLGNGNIYRRLSFVDVSIVENRINTVWKNICKQRNVRKNVEIMYSSTASRLATFKGLIKTHKGINELKIRPVVNTISSPTYKICWLLQKILQVALDKPSSSFRSSSDILNNIIMNRSNINTQYKYPFSLDVVAMYTSIPAQEAADMFCQSLAAKNFNYCGLTPSDFRALLKVILDNSFFKFENYFYKQISGLPMGSKISPFLADFYMELVERPLISQLSLPFYYRYVDDCLLIVKSEDEAINIYNNFNSANHHVKFEIEHPKNDGSISLLDFNINVNGDVPILKPYTKTIKSDIFVSASSAIPDQLKRNIIINEWKRLRERCASMEEKIECRRNFIDKLRRNEHHHIPALHLNDYPPAVTRENGRPIFYISLPFINNQTTKRIKQIFSNLGYEIRISHRGRKLYNFINPGNFQAPTRNGQCNLRACRMNNNNCFKSMCVYEAVCNVCGSNYIGSTKKFLHIRVSEHFRQSSSQIYRHNDVCKGEWSIKVRNTFSSLQDLRWGEAILIKKDNPTLNRREEGMGLLSLIT